MINNVVLPICHYGEEVSIKTSWMDNNSGRRYRNGFPFDLDDHKNKMELAVNLNFIFTWGDGEIEDRAKVSTSPLFEG